MRRRLIRVGVVAGLTALWMLQAPPAGAFHLFPLVPGDPTGDCVAALQAAPAGVEPQVLVEGFFFVDKADGDSTIEVKAGDSVTWEWVKFCHSVTSTSVPDGASSFSTEGGPPSGPVPASQHALVKPEGDRTTYTVRFTVPGTYRYECVHHNVVGMLGTVVVTP